MSVFVLLYAAAVPCSPCIYGTSAVPGVGASLADVQQLDHRNDIVVNTFGLIMSIVGTAVVWWIDPLGAILIGCLILFSWASTAYEQIWLLVGKSAPREFLSKLIYISITHDEHILKVDTVSSSSTTTL